MNSFRDHSLIQSFYTQTSFSVQTHVNWTRVFKNKTFLTFVFILINMLLLFLGLLALRLNRLIFYLTFQGKHIHIY